MRKPNSVKLTVAETADRKARVAHALRSTFLSQLADIDELQSSAPYTLSRPTNRAKALSATSKGK